MPTPQDPLTSFESGSPPPGVEGTPEALDRLWLAMHGELRRVAHRRLRLERGGHTLSTTALLHEVYLKLLSQRNVPWADEGQFFALAARAMRRILIDYARRHLRMRDRQRYDSLDAQHTGPDNGSLAVQLPGAQRADSFLELDEALDRLACLDARLAKVVECRFFAGYTEEETARALGVTSRTVTRDWAKAKAWLHRELRDVEPS